MESASGYTKVNLAIMVFLLMRGGPAVKMPNHSEMLLSSWDLTSWDQSCVQKREYSTMILGLHLILDKRPRSDDFKS